MPYTKVIKVSDKVYEKLQELADSMRVTPNKVIEALLERVTPNSPNRENTNSPNREDSSSPTQEKISPRREWGNPIDYVENGVTPPRKCVATKVGKSYLIECEDGARAFVPSNAIPDLVERFGLVVREK
jgi:hypothetical protein